MPNTGFGSFLLVIGLAILFAGLLFKFVIRQAPKGELRGYWKRPRA